MAIDEYEELKKRYDHLLAEKADLELSIKISKTRSSTSTKLRKNVSRKLLMRSTIASHASSRLFSAAAPRISLWSIRKARPTFSKQASTFWLSLQARKYRTSRFSPGAKKL